MRIKLSRAMVLLVLGAGVLASGSGLAHHSYAMFDRQTTKTLKATVRTWEFVSPHAYLWVYVDDADGKPQLWGLEGPGPQGLLRAGWNKNTVKPGDKVTVDINPLRDGRNGGNLVRMTLGDGRVMEVGALPGAPDGASVLNNGPETVTGK
jgi:hypothetical protein